MITREILQNKAKGSNANRLDKYKCPYCNENYRTAGAYNQHLNKCKRENEKKKM
jgi:hypothetical protein